MNEPNRPSYYAVIPAEVRYCEELKFAERLLYGEITALAGKEGYCFASNRYFAELYNVIPGTISRWISHLEKMVFIKTEMITDARNQIIERRIYVKDIHREMIQCTYKQNKQYPYKQNERYSISRKAKDNNINNNIDRLFSYIIKRNHKFLEEMIKENYIVFWRTIERLEFDYTEDVVEIFTKDNLEKVKVIIYLIKELIESKKQILLKKATRNKLVEIYDNSKRTNLLYENTEKRIENFLNYYYISVINELERK